MEQTANKQYCQSCGMPLRFDVKEYLGTNADHSHSHEYCYYCLKDGEYTVDISMGEMVDIWIKYTDKYNGYAGTNYSPQELRTLLNKRLPALKRWQQKEETENIHSSAINRVKAYIDSNLFSELKPEQLAASTNLSLFHFRRVFLNMAGENIGIYIQRLRLEYIAHLLTTTNQSIQDIQRQTNYQTKFSLAKAFRKHFGLSMSDYRAKYQLAGMEHTPDNLPHAEIRRISTQKAICLDAKGAFRNVRTYQNLWKQLAYYKEKHLIRAANSNYVSISPDNPRIASTDLRRLYIGIIAVEEMKPEGKFHVYELPGGMYAVFTHKGSYSLLPELYKGIYEQWLPLSKYIQKQPLSFEVYLNTPKEVPTDELITEVHISIDHQ